MPARPAVDGGAKNGRQSGPGRIPHRGRRVRAPAVGALFDRKYRVHRAGPARHRQPASFGGPEPAQRELRLDAKGHRRLSSSAFTPQRRAPVKFPPGRDGIGGEEAGRQPRGREGSTTPASFGVYTSNNISRSSRVRDFQESWPGMTASATPRFISCNLRIFSSTVFWQISL